MRARKRMILFGSLFAFLFGVFVVGSIIYFLRPREPVYEGKSLSAWIAPFCQQTKTGLAAPGGPAHFEELQPVRHAVAAMGTNALPFLVARLNYRESAVHKKLRQLMDKQPFVTLQLADPRVEYIQAIRALAILGPKANPTISNLVSRLTDPLLSSHVIYALQAIGEKGMRALLNETTNHSSLIRMQIADAFITYSADTSLKTNASATYITALGLTRIAQDSSAFFRVPAIHRLGLLGAVASNAVPVLTNCLNDPDTPVRMAAATTLQRLGYAVDIPSLMPGGSRAPRIMFTPPGTNSFRPRSQPIVFPQ